MTKTYVTEKEIDLEVELMMFQLDSAFLAEGSSMTVEEFRSVVKKKLVELLIEKIVEKNCIEFTSRTDVYNDLTHYRARMYVTPDTQVRVIRKIIKESN